MLYILQEALEIRTYLHDRALMQYGDRLEASGKCLPELLNLSTAELASQYGLRRGHAARFVDRTNACGDPSPKSFSISARGTASRTSSIYKHFESVNSSKAPTKTKSFPRSSTNDKLSEQSLADFKIKDGYVFKGIVAAEPAEPRACGCVQPTPLVEEAAPYSAIENISVQKLTPEYKVGMDRLVKTKTPPMKASELWRDKPAILLCIRRPG